MQKNRVESFSDGVLAIVITLMALELKVPTGASFSTLEPVVPFFLSYLISFALVGIYWSNHHHLLQTIRLVNTPILLANLNLLMWLALVPVTTAWMGATNFAHVPILVYGGLLLVCALSYRLLQHLILKTHNQRNALGLAIAKQGKRVVVSVLALVLAFPASFVHWGLAAFLFLLHSLIWIIPDKEIEQALHQEDGTHALEEQEKKVVENSQPVEG